jgi:hypothetical protein
MPRRAASDRGGSAADGAADGAEVADVTAISGSG